MYTALLSPAPQIFATKTTSSSRRKCYSKTIISSPPSLCSFSESYSIPSFTSISCISNNNPTTSIIEPDSSSRNLLSQCSYANTLPCMKGNNYGAFGNGTLTLERAPLDMSKTSEATKPGPLLDTGGYGGDRGGSYGIGSGGSGRGDDDEYNWNNIDPDDDNGDNDDPFGFFRLRSLIPETFDKEVIDAVLSEWMKTIKDLPSGLKHAYTLGMLSSAQFTKFLWFNARPSFTRVLCRALPEGLSRDFSGKMIVDPSLPCKLFLEALSSLGFSLYFDTKQRGIKNMKKEWNLVLTNAITATACNTFIVWSLAPCYRYGGGFGFQWLNIFGNKLPNNVFEKSYRFHEFNLQRRGLSYFNKAVNLFTLGVTTRMAQIGLSIACMKDKEEKRLMVSKMGGSAFNAGLSLGLYSNLRYQLLCGVDRGLVSCFDVVGVSLCFGSAIRILNAKIGAQSLGFVGSEEIFHLVHSLTAYKDSNASSNWFDIKSVLSSGFHIIDSTCHKVMSSSKKRKKNIKKKIAAIA